MESRGFGIVSNCSTLFEMKHSKYKDIGSFLELARDGLAEMGNEILRRTEAKGSPLTPAERTQAIIEGVRRWRKVREEKLKTLE